MALADESCHLCRGNLLPQLRNHMSSAEEYWPMQGNIVDSAQEFCEPLHRNIVAPAQEYCGPCTGNTVAHAWEYRGPCIEIVWHKSPSTKPFGPSRGILWALAVESCGLSKRIFWPQHWNLVGPIRGILLSPAEEYCLPQQESLWPQQQNLVAPVKES